MSTGTMSSGNATTPAKLCRKCGRDITHERRLKDANGNYWCSSCGVPADSAGSGSALISPCPKCHAPTHAAHMIRKNGVYVCEACANGTNKRNRKRTPVHAEIPSGVSIATVPLAAAARGDALSDDERRKRKLMILGVMMIIAGGLLFFFLNGVLNG